MAGCSIQRTTLLILLLTHQTSMKDKLVLGPNFTLDFFHPSHNIERLLDGIGPELALAAAG